jgi:hypothetical protein
LQAFYVVNGRPMIYGDALVAVVRRSGKCRYIKHWFEGEDDHFTCVVETQREGEPEPTVGRFSVADAKRANLWGKDTWKAYPKRMLLSKARGYLLKDTYADILHGFNDDLTNDMPEPADVGSITAHGDEAPPEPTTDHPEDVIDVEVEEMPPDPDTPVDTDSSFELSASSEAENLLGELDARLRTTTTADEMEAAIEEMDVFATLEADEDSQAAAHAIITKHTKRIARL